MNKPRIVSGVDYLEYPPPDTLYRATQKAYAHELIDRGMLRFTLLTRYKTIGNTVYQDSTEGRGVFIRQGTRCPIGFTNPVSVFCASTNSNPQELLNRFSGCDTVLRIDNTSEFAERVLACCQKLGFNGVGFAAGEVSYDKLEGGTRSHHGQEGLFQKSIDYMIEKEFRFALYHRISSSCPPLYYNIELGNCSDLISVFYRRS